MTEVNEFWANVYPGYDGEGVGPMGRVAHAGQHHPSRESTEMWAMDDVLFRIHVRLKPEGAPKRYASADERWWWENDTKWMRARAEDRP